MKKIITSTLLASALATSVSADFLGAEVGYAAWAPKTTGDIKYSAQGSKINFEDDLGYEGTDLNGFAWAYFDHFIPLIPNVKVQQTNYSSSQAHTVTTNFTFKTTDYAPTNNITTDLVLNQKDIILYWRILDNWVNLDLGFMGKQIDGSMSITRGSDVNSVDFTTTVPLAYIKARFDLPFSGLSVEADYSTVSYLGNSITDMKGGVVYESSFGLGAVAGIKKQNITLDDIDAIYADIDIEGVYAGLFFHF